MKLPRKTSLALALCLLVSLALNPALAAKRVKPIPEVLAKREVIAAPQTRTLRLDEDGKPCEQCNHAPVVEMAERDFTAAPGEAVSFAATLSDPADAQSGDSFLLTLRARDAADAPMTRYAQVQIIVK